MADASTLRCGRLAVSALSSTKQRVLLALYVPAALRLQLHSSAMRLHPRLAGTLNSIAILRHLALERTLV